MKPALVMIPHISGVYDREKYLTSCIQYVSGNGFFPISKDLYNGYMNMENHEFLTAMIDIPAQIYLFIDFGMSPLMKDMATIAAKRDIPTEYIKLIKNEADYKIIENSPEAILREVSKKTDIPLELLKGNTRKREVVDARYVYFKRAREIFGTKYSLKKIGREVNRDHATVMWGIEEAGKTSQIIELYNYCYGE
jgi:hypothetical protein